MAELKPPMFEGLEVSLGLYETSYVINTLESMKDDGLLDGGLYVDRGKIREIVRIGEEFGYAKPDADRVESILAEILMFPFAEEDDEDETEVQD